MAAGQPKALAQHLHGLPFGERLQARIHPLGSESEVLLVTAFGSFILDLPESLLERSGERRAERIALLADPMSSDRRQMQPKQIEHIDAVLNPRGIGNRGENLHQQQALDGHDRNAQPVFPVNRFALREVDQRKAQGMPGHQHIYPLRQFKQFGQWMSNVADESTVPLLGGEPKTRKRTLRRGQVCLTDQESHVHRGARDALRRKRHAAHQRVGDALRAKIQRDIAQHFLQSTR